MRGFERIFKHTRVLAIGIPRSILGVARIPKQTVVPVTGLGSGGTTPRLMLGVAKIPKHTVVPVTGLGFGGGILRFIPGVEMTSRPMRVGVIGPVGIPRFIRGMSSGLMGGVVSGVGMIRLGGIPCSIAAGIFLESRASL